MGGMWVKPSVGVTEEALRAWLELSGRPYHGSVDRVARVVWLRYCTEDPLTLRQIGLKMGISHARVRSLETKGLLILRDPAVWRHVTVEPGTRLWYALRELPVPRWLLNIPSDGGHK